MIQFILGISALIAVSSAQAQNVNCLVNSYNEQICLRDAVSSTYNNFSGTVVRVDRRYHSLDVRWDIIGNGQIQNVHPDNVRPYHSGYPDDPPPAPRCGRDYYGSRICLRDVVRYTRGNAVGTIVRVYEGNLFDVDWNIVGHGFGRRMSGRTLIRY